MWRTSFARDTSCVYDKGANLPSSLQFTKAQAQAILIHCRSWHQLQRAELADQPGRNRKPRPREVDLESLNRLIFFMIGDDRDSPRCPMDNKVQVLLLNCNLVLLSKVECSSPPTWHYKGRYQNVINQVMQPYKNEGLTKKNNDKNLLQPHGR